MTPERIAEMRNDAKHDALFESWEVLALLDDLEAANAELQRLQSSPAPVVGGVPEPPEESELYDTLGDADCEASYETISSYLMGWRHCGEAVASRLSSIKPGEEVVNSEEYAALLDFAERIVPIRDNLSGISWVGNLKDVFAAYDNWYAIRIAQGTSTEKETKNV